MGIFPAWKISQHIRSDEEKEFCDRVLLTKVRAREIGITRSPLRHFVIARLDLWKVSNSQLAHFAASDVFGKIQDNGKQEGVDFTNELLAGIANGGDFDFSSLFGGLTESEVTDLESLTAD